MPHEQSTCDSLKPLPIRSRNQFIPSRSWGSLCTRVQHYWSATSVPRPLALRLYPRALQDNSPLQVLPYSRILLPSVKDTAKHRVEYIPALVIACRYFLSCTSPAANTPAMLVLVVPGCVNSYPS